MENKEQISPMMLAFSVCCFIQASASLSSFIMGTVKQDSWIVGIMGFLVSLPVLWIYMTLAEMFPGKTIIEMNDCVFGNVLGKVFSIMYLWFFFSLTFLNSRAMGDFVVGYIIPETPLPAVLIMFVFVCGWAARKGVETMTRYSTLFVAIAIAFVIVSSILLVKESKISNFLPMLSYPVKDYIKGTHIMMAVPFCEIMAFMMLLPNLPQKTNIKKPFYAGFIIGAVTWVLSIVRNVAVLGSTSSFMSFPSFDAIRLVNIGNSLTRTEVLYVTLLLILHFFKISILLFAVAYGVAQMLHLKSYKILVPVITVLVISFAIEAFGSAVEYQYWGQNIAAIYSTFFEIVLPAITLITAVIRKLFRLKEVEAA